MYDDLTWVERNYGCVAEYNRCMAERDYEDYEPTEEEIAEENRKMKAYQAEIERLNGTESELARNLFSEWEKSKPKWDDTMHGVYAIRDWAKAKTLAVVQQIADYYGVKVDEDWSTFYRPPEGLYAISVEYNDGCYIKNKYIGNLNFEQFKNVFRDLYYTKCHPCAHLGKGKILSNCSLGELLRNYIKEE